jgi:thymidine kinase
MKLSQEQKDYLAGKLTGINDVCSSCGHTGFTVLDKIFEMREFNEGNLITVGDSSTIPAVVLVCNNCAEVRLLSALALGVLDNTEKQVKKEDDE